MNTSIHDWLQSATSTLKQAKIETARLDALLLLEHALGQSREWVLAHGDLTLSTDERSVLSKMVIRRKSREPVAYIIDSKEFYGHEFYVNDSVLIPRPESESMIELLKSVASSQDINTIIDVGTGSGCLAITAKLLFPDIHVTAVDLSNNALAVARKNARNHAVHIQFRQLDLRDRLPAMPKTRPYILLANLPYVPQGMITSPEITKEPAEALFSGYDGLEHYIAFWNQIQDLKNKPMCVITESLEVQHSQLIKLAQEAGYQLRATDTLAQLFVYVTT